MADKIFGQEDFYRVYKKRLNTYVNAISYNKDKDFSLSSKFSTAGSVLRRYLVQQHAKQGVTEAMAEKMYGYDGGELKIPSDRSYMNRRRYPELGRLHDEAEDARKNYNDFIWWRVHNFIDRIIEISGALKFNKVPANMLKEAKLFVSFEDKLTEIRDNGYWEFGENAKRYKEQEDKKEKQYVRDFERSHPGYKEERDEEWQRLQRASIRYGRQSYSSMKEIDERYGFVPYKRERLVILECSGVYFDFVDYREKSVYEKQKSLGNLENYYRGVDQALKEIYPNKSADDRIDFWKRHFKLPYVVYPEKKDETFTVPKGTKVVSQNVIKKDRQFVKTIVLPEGVTEIEEGAFKGCKSLVSINLPSSITTIGPEAFSGCKSLKQITLPPNIQIIYGDTFYECTSLQQIVIPDKVTNIYARAFGDCKNLKNVVFGKNLKKVYLYAFENCTSLKSVELPKGCQYDKGLAFDNSCKVTFYADKPTASTAKPIAPKTQPTAVASTPKTSTVVSKPNGTFAMPNLPTTDESLFKIENGNCKKYLGKEENVVIPSGIKKVGSSSFGLARKFVKYIVVPEGVKEIGSLAFCDCKKLETVVLPSTLKVVKNQVFDGCDSLTKIVFPVGYNNKDVLDCLPKNCQVVFGVEKEAEKPQQTAISAPKQEENPYVWQPPKELESDFRIEKELLKKYVGKGQKVVVPNGITRMWEGAFDKAKDFLISITLPEGFVEIPKDAFKDCTKLEEVYLPASLQKIGFGAFSNCPNLKTVCLADKSQLNDVRSHAFEGCDSLKQIVLPKDCEYDKEGYFASFPQNCKVLIEGQKQTSTSTKTTRTKTEVAKPTVDITTLAQTDESLFEIVNGVCKKYLGKDQVVVLPKGIKKIGSSAFQDNLSVKHVVLPEGAKEILTYAFAGCENLQRVDLPSSLRAIKTSAFWSCASLKQIDLPDGIKQIGSHAFSGCASLQKVVIPSCVDKIESFTFGDCKNLSEVVFADSIKELEFAAFDNCDSLKEVTLPKGCKLGYFITGPFPSSCKIKYK